MPPGQSALNVEIQVDTTALAAKLQAAVQQAVAKQRGGGQGGAPAAGAGTSPAGLPPWNPIPVPVPGAGSAPPTAWAPPPAPPKPPTTSLVLGQGANYNWLRNKAKAVLRGGIRYGVTAGIIYATDLYLNSIGDEDEASVVNELKKAAAPAIGTGVATALVAQSIATGGGAAVVVLALEVLRRSVEFLTFKADYAEKEWKELRKKTQRLEESMIKANTDLRWLETQIDNDIRLKLHKMEEDSADDLYDAIRAMPYPYQ